MKPGSESNQDNFRGSSRAALLRLALLNGDLSLLAPEAYTTSGFSSDGFMTSQGYVKRMKPDHNGDSSVIGGPQKSRWLHPFDIESSAINLPILYRNNFFRLGGLYHPVHGDCPAYIWEVETLIDMAPIQLKWRETWLSMRPLTARPQPLEGETTEQMIYSKMVPWETKNPIWGHFSPSGVIFAFKSLAEMVEQHFQLRETLTSMMFDVLKSLHEEALEGRQPQAQGVANSEVWAGRYKREISPRSGASSDDEADQKRRKSIVRVPESLFEAGTDDAGSHSITEDCDVEHESDPREDQDSETGPLVSGNLEKPRTASNILRRQLRNMFLDGVVAASRQSSTTSAEGPVPNGSEWEVLPHPEYRSMSICWVLEPFRESEGDDGAGMNDPEELGDDGVGSETGTKRKWNGRSVDDGKSDDTETNVFNRGHYRVVNKVKGMWEIMELPWERYKFV
ncbi:hypothetical protein CSAL01_02667 [Colletotrichum salicis]|uniref:Uncharacterized protein n=1 Tax=Colletotrichum salicis TaxID=1209931 RepID=A0A135SKK7_9PEZI|nr:hypothetical protein CSAL01_02667 [Colletotrichum salicis]